MSSTVACVTDAGMLLASMRTTAARSASSGTIFVSDGSCGLAADDACASATVPKNMAMTPIGTKAALNARVRQCAHAGIK
jgi:hypothetical protein